MNSHILAVNMCFRPKELCDVLVKVYDKPTTYKDSLLTKFAIIAKIKTNNANNPLYID